MGRVSPETRPTIEVVCPSLPFSAPGAEGISDADLEAELLALEGKAPAKGKSGKTGKSGMLSMGELDAMVAGIGDVGEDEDEDEEGDFSDEDELLGELQVC